LAYPRLQRSGYTEEGVDTFVETLRAACHFMQVFLQLRVIPEDPVDEVVLAMGVITQAEDIVTKDEPPKASGAPAHPYPFHR